jgi:hypothetical protein
MDYLKPEQNRNGSSESRKNILGVSLLHKMSTATTRSLAKGEDKFSPPPSSGRNENAVDDGTRTIGGWSNNPPL